MIWFVFGGKEGTVMLGGGIFLYHIPSLYSSSNRQNSNTCLLYSTKDSLWVVKGYIDLSLAIKYLWYRHYHNYVLKRKVFNFWKKNIAITFNLALFPFFFPPSICMFVWLFICMLEYVVYAEAGEQHLLFVQLQLQATQDHTYSHARELVSFLTVLLVYTSLI